MKLVGSMYPRRAEICSTDSTYSRKNSLASAYRTSSRIAIQHGPALIFRCFQCQFIGLCERFHERLRIQDGQMGRCIELRPHATESLVPLPKALSSPWTESWQKAGRHLPVMPMRSAPTLTTSVSLPTCLVTVSRPSPAIACRGFWTSSPLAAV